MNFLTTSAVIDSVVLAEVCKEETYGYVLTQRVTKVLGISESTLYPALRRLQKDGLLETFDQTENGRNRRYYKITAGGRAKFKEYLNNWNEIKTKLDEIYEGASDE